jgi:hypothetical protein
MGLGLAVVALLLALSSVPAVPAAAALLLAVAELGHAVRHAAPARSLCSPAPGQWRVSTAGNEPQAVRLVRAWALGPWVAAATFAGPGGHRVTVTVLRRDQAPGAWRRFIARLRNASSS